MLDRASLLDRMDAALDARMRGDTEAMAGFLAPGATFRIAGQPAAEGFLPDGPAEAAEVMHPIVERIRFHRVERLDTLVDGNRVAARLSIDFSIGDAAPASTETLDLWTFDEEGRITDILQFVDTALLAERLSAP
jgi:ketosteroid isomerase-like protein